MNKLWISTWKFTCILFVHSLIILHLKTIYECAQTDDIKKRISERVFFTVSYCNTIWIWIHIRCFHKMASLGVYQNLIGIIIIIVTIAACTLNIMHMHKLRFHWLMLRTDRRTYMWSQKSNDAHPTLCLMTSNSSRKLWRFTWNAFEPCVFVSFAFMKWHAK